MNCERSFLRDCSIDWQVAHASKKPEEWIAKRKESIEKAVYAKGYTDRTCRKWMFYLLEWADKRDNKF